MDCYWNHAILSSIMNRIRIFQENFDLWAVGVVCYQMLPGRLPLDQENQMESFSTQTEYTGHFQKQKFIKLYPLIIDFIKSILKWDQDKRITSQEALLHPQVQQQQQQKIVFSQSLGIIKEEPETSLVNNFIANIQSKVEN